MSSEITIPTEVLCDIFHLLCDAPIALHDLKNESHFHEFPWAVGQVSRHWRQAFLSYTYLWTSFALKPGTFNVAHFVEMNRRATIYLERSGQQPLTILMSMPCSDTEKFPKSVWRMLLSCLERWKRANLELDHRLALNELLICRGHMLSLESLRISIPDSLALNHYNAFQIAPHLIELDLAHPNYVATWQFPWAQLTKLRIEASYEEFNSHYSVNLWGVLFNLKNIQELHIITTFGCVTLPSPLPIIPLPSLWHLEISLAFGMMFSWFTAPLLENLHIHGCKPYCSYHHEPYERELASLIQRSSCHIRRLALQKCREEEMRIMIKVLTNVQEVFISYIHSPEFALIQDIAGLDGPIYLPKLQVLRLTCGLTGNHRVENIVTEFSRLLEARGKGLSLASHNIIVPLEKFVLRLFPREEKCSDKVLEVMRSWPSFAQVYINGSATPSL